MSQHPETPLQVSLLTVLLLLSPGCEDSTTAQADLSHHADTGTDTGAGADSDTTGTELDYHTDQDDPGTDDTIDDTPLPDRIGDWSTDEDLLDGADGFGDSAPDYDLRPFSPYYDMRNQLVEHIWGPGGLPTEGVDNIVENHPAPNWADLEDLSRIDRLEIELGYELQSIAYHFHPEVPNNRLIIYHQGHSGGFYRGKKTIQYFLSRGYAVLAFSMPLTGMNPQPTVTLPSGTVVALEEHGDFSVFEQEGIATMPFFIEPVVRGINYAETHFDYTSVDMVGLSGGAWTATLVAAIDTRIERSYPVAGSLPFDLRTEARDVGDFEQMRDRPVYEIALYVDLYVLGALGWNRRQLQVLNAHDPCCYAASGKEDLIAEYEQYVAAELGDREEDHFSVYVDYSHREHAISDDVLALIADDLVR